jgi:hypothetical protein
MELKPHSELIGLDKALKDGQANYPEIRMANLQRGYEWESAHWKSLYDETFDEAHKIYPPNTPGLKGPFIGALILIEVDGPPDPQTGYATPKTCELVDGQQRVTTTFILASVIRDHLLECNSRLPALAKLIDPDDDEATRNAQKVIVRSGDSITYIRDFLTHKITPGQRVSRLITWDYLIPYLQNEVLKEKANLSARRLLNRGSDPLTKRFVAAINGLRGLVSASLAKIASDIEKDHTDDDVLGWLIVSKQTSFLISMFETLTNSMFVVKLTTDNHRDAGEVFLSLNSKGKALGVKDIVKAALLDKHSHSKVEEKNFSDSWGLLEKQVGDLNPFLRLAWMTRTGKKSTEKSVATSILTFLEDREKDPKAQARTLANQLFDYGNLLSGATLPRGSHQYIVTANNFAITRLEALEKSKQSAYKFFLLPYLKRIGGQTVAAEVEEVIKLIYTFAFTWRGVFSLPQEVEDFYFDLGIKIGNQHKWATAVPELRATVSKALANFDASALKATEVLLVLHSLEEAVREKNNATSVGWKAHSDEIEHTAPKKSTPSWVSALGVSGDAYKEAIAKVGNLTLLNRSQNGRIGQKPWSDPSHPSDKSKSKREAYKQSVDFQTTIDLSSNVAWTLNLIEERTNWIIKTVKSVYEPATGSATSFQNFSQYLSKPTP